MSCRFTIILISYVWMLLATHIGGQRVRIEGRVYEHQQPMELGITNCYSQDSSQCQMLQQSICSTLIELLPVYVGGSARCENYVVQKDENNYFSLGFEIQFQFRGEDLQKMNVSCSTFTSLYLMEIRRSHQTGRKTLGDPVIIGPDLYDIDWNTNVVDFSVRGTLLVNGSRVPITSKDNLNLKNIESGLYRMPGIHTMISPMLSRDQASLSNVNVHNVNGFAGVSFILTYEKAALKSYNLDPSCTTFPYLLQQAFRNPTTRSGIQLDRDAVVTMMTHLTTKKVVDTERENQRRTPSKTDRAEVEQRSTEPKQDFRALTTEQQSYTSEGTSASGYDEGDENSKEEGLDKNEDGTNSGSLLSFGAQLSVLTLLTLCIH
ncbi:hypothetical protein D915_000796 [Fasciola hepatica]|uniref:Uncharacterized protein n=1 Tax=Fasciola hepatica TaxID=6192 RepID=A0A4E0RR40_FASHE|nr:hypothetical protein D915_000796 [Fasciola hepatica]